MARKKTEIEQAKADTLKMGRSVIRLKHSVAADNELNEKLPLLEKAFDQAVMSGELPSGATMRELLAVVLDA